LLRSLGADGALIFREGNFVRRMPATTGEAERIGMTGSLASDSPSPERAKPQGRNGQEGKSNKGEVDPVAKKGKETPGKMCLRAWAARKI